VAEFLQELLLEGAWANGYTGRNFRDHRTVLRYAFGRGIEAGFSTVDVGGILSNVANKFLLDGFFSVERTWRNVCAVRNVSDFKTVTSYRLVGKDQYELVPPGGELKHGTLGNETYSNKADTYGLMLSVDRRDIINDDLGAITTVPQKLGRGSGLKINDVFWTTFLTNAAFFTAGNVNYISGAGTALGIDGLTAGEVAFLDQTDGDGNHHPSVRGVASGTRSGGAGAHGLRTPGREVRRGDCRPAGPRPPSDEPSRPVSGRAGTRKQGRAAQSRRHDPGGAVHLQLAGRARQRDRPARGRSGA